MGMFELSVLDIISLQGSDIAHFKKAIECVPGLLKDFSQKETWTSERLRKSGRGGKYVADLLEGKSTIPDTPEELAEKAIKESG